MVHNCKLLEHKPAYQFAVGLACSWLRGTVLRTLIFDWRTFLSHARPAADV